MHYVLRNLDTSEFLVVKAGVDDPDPVAPLGGAALAGGGLDEREVFDMYGIRFSGHPDLRRILMPDEFTAYSAPQGLSVARSRRASQFPAAHARRVVTAVPPVAIVRTEHERRRSRRQDHDDAASQIYYPTNADDFEAETRSRRPGPSTSGPSIPPRTRRCG